MVTFSDLMTLLLTFFVLLLSMSSMNINLLEQFFSVFTGAAGPLTFAKQAEVTTVEPALEELRFAIYSQGKLDDEGLERLLFQYESDKRSDAEQLVSDDIEVARSRRGLRIRFKDRIFFDPGSADLRPDALPFLSRLAQIIRYSRFQVSVEGHSDSSPIHSGGFSSNWDLSMARAIRVVEYFTEVNNLGANRFRVGGYGPSRPLFSNDTPENRRKNRRIEVFLYQRD
jgi:chemotaxis protein MotB